MLKLLLFFLSLSLNAAVSTGTGADGACNQTTIQNADGGPYNCTSLITSGNIIITGTSNLTIYVQGIVTISHQITLTGGPGDNGPANELITAAGGTAGAGGNVGGEITAGTAVTGTSGGGIGGGTRGRGGYLEIGDTVAAGGGGGGGSHGGHGTSGSDGDFVASDPGSISGVGGSRGDIPYTASSLLELVPNVPGGAGGGAGGAGMEDGGNPASGGGGGGSGGSITIIAGGAISIEAGGQINASGGVGGDGHSADGVGANAPGGAGGSGSGGTIFLYSKTTIVNNGTLIALGGAAVAAKTDGSTGDTGGAGGAGGAGIIRLDDFDATIGGAGSSNPAAQVFSSKPLFESDQIGFYCGSIEYPSNPLGPLLSLLLGLIPLILISINRQRETRHLKPETV